jgi:hypothetical protein
MPGIGAIVLWGAWRVKAFMDDYLAAIENKKRIADFISLILPRLHARQKLSI